MNENRKQRNITAKQILGLFAVVLLVSVVVMAGTAAAKSAYLSANHHTQQFDAWNINPNGTVTKQATYTLQHSTDPSGIGIDAIPATAPVIFISSEFSGGIEMVDPLTLEYIGVSSGPSNLAGIDVDDLDDIVYTLKRQTNDLYIYSWDPANKTLTQLFVIDLPGLSQGYGLALDDSRDILWVSDTPNSMVRAYNVSNLSNIVEISALSRQLNHTVVDVAVDTRRNMVYTVGGWAGSTLLSKYDVGAGTETTINLGVGGIGVAVDEDTGYVYMTRGTSSSGDDIQVWDPSTSPFTLVQDTPSIGNPAGICIANVGFNLLNLSKDDGVTACVKPGDSITYTICYDNMQNNSDDVHNVTIVDDLPAEVSFVSTTGGGTYDSIARTVTWNVGTLAGGAQQQCVQLVVDLDTTVTPGSNITNYATINSDETPATTVSETTAVCPNQPPVADAGSYQYIETTEPGDVSVTLDGSGSTDDGRILPLTYEWTWSGGSATGISPAITLPVGVTTVTLTVFDGQYYDTDTVTIRIVNPLTAVPAISPIGIIALIGVLGFIGAGVIRRRR